MELLKIETESGAKMKKLSKNEYYHLLIQLEAISGNLESSEEEKLKAKLEIMRTLARFTVKK